MTFTTFPYSQINHRSEKKTNCTFTTTGWRESESGPNVCFSVHAGVAQGRLRVWAPRVNGDTITVLLCRVPWHLLDKRVPPAPPHRPKKHAAKGTAHPLFCCSIGSAHQKRQLIGGPKHAKILNSNKRASISVPLRYCTP